MHTFDIPTQGGGGVMNELVDRLRRWRQPATPALDGGPL